MCLEFIVLTIIHNNQNYESLRFKSISPYVAGTPEDKMRLFLIYYISAQQAPSEVCPLYSVIGGRGYTCLFQNRSKNHYGQITTSFLFLKEKQFVKAGSIYC